MAQKITLSVPDMLYERIKQWRDSFNLSKMFQDAITDAIQKKEEFQKRFHKEFDLPDIIRRLQEEKRASEQHFYELGKTAGLKWAKSAHYDDLVTALEYDPATSVTKLAQDHRFKAYFDSMFTKVGIRRYRVVGSSDHEILFLKGWRNSVGQFWNEIKEAL